MRLRFLCSNHRNWLTADGEAAEDFWRRSYAQADLFLQTREHFKAVNHAGCALETAELLLLAHARKAAEDISRFTDSAALLCRSLLQADQHRLACRVIGGCITRLEELLLEGGDRRTVLQACQRLLTLDDDPPVGDHSTRRQLLPYGRNWSVH